MASKAWKLAQCLYAQASDLDSEREKERRYETVKKGTNSAKKKQFSVMFLSKEQLS